MGVPLLGVGVPLLDETRPDAVLGVQRPRCGISAALSFIPLPGARVRRERPPERRQRGQLAASLLAPRSSAPRGRGGSEFVQFIPARELAATMAAIKKARRRHARVPWPAEEEGVDAADARAPVAGGDS